MTSVTSPREVPPPCVKGAAVFDGRQTTWHDTDSCPKHYHQGHHICYGIAKGPEHGAGDDIHPSFSVLMDDRECIFTDDADEAAAAFNRGREYVLTGVLE